MTTGFIPAWRKLFEPDHPLAKRHPACPRFAWLDLCQMAAHERYRKWDEVLERGELLASLRFLAKRWRWDFRRVSRFVSGLEIDTAIEKVRETPHGTVYRIVNYDTYAILSGGPRDTERDSQRDSSETAMRQTQPLKHSTIGKETTAAAPPEGVENSAEGGDDTDWRQRHVDCERHSDPVTMGESAQSGQTNIPPRANGPAGSPYDLAAEELLGCPPIEPDNRLSTSALVELADERLGLGTAFPSNRRLIVQWEGRGRSLEEIEAAILGLADMRDRDLVGWDSAKPGTPMTCRALENTHTLWESGDGRTQRVLWDVAVEHYRRTAEPQSKPTMGGLKRIGEVA